MVSNERVSAEKDMSDWAGDAEKSRSQLAKKKISRRVSRAVFILTNIRKKGEKREGDEVFVTLCAWGVWG